MIPTTKQPAKKQTMTEEHSPWTETFQRVEEPNRTDADSATQPETTQSSQRAQATQRHTDEPTHDALSTIFNGH